MKAIQYRSYGGSEALEFGEVEEPKIGPDWVKVAVRATSVNPVDWKLASGGLDGALDVFFPVTPGWDVAGIVEEVGPAVTELAVGDEVFGYVRKDAVRGGTYAEKVSAPIRTLTHKPTNMSFAQAAAIPLAGLTAYQSLVHCLKVGEGDTVLVHAAAGGVGSFAVQIAVAQGARVIGTASEDNHDYVRGLGGEPITYGDGLVDRVRQLAPEGVDAIFDTIGGETLALSGDLLADDAAGRVVSIADPGVRELGGAYVFVRPDVDDLNALAGLAQAGKLTVEVAASYPLSEAARAWEASMGGHTRGKIVLIVD
ncbi:MAG: NADP-dependent oxidoreductase [Propionibacteriales bacterium]|nr:NADP-dependent oxidoreductase [Propionibacteriales bacterium]